MEYLLNDFEDRPNQHQNSHKLSDETGHPGNVITSMANDYVNN